MKVLWEVVCYNDYPDLIFHSPGSGLPPGCGKGSLLLSGHIGRNAALLFPLLLDGGKIPCFYVRKLRASGCFLATPRYTYSPKDHGGVGVWPRRRFPAASLFLRGEVWGKSIAT